MAVQKTTRLNLTRWTGDTDAFNREQLDADHGELEARVPRWRQRTIAGDPVRPATGSEWTGGFFYDRTTATLSYSDGSEWVDLVLAGKATANVTYSDAGTIVAGTTNGLKILTSATQKLGFYNKTPIVQPSSATKTRDVLINLGLVASGGSTPIELQVVRTGTARPATGAFVGDTIWEERTQAFQVWNGASWVSNPACGDIVMSTRTSAAPGYLACNGAAIAATYTELIVLYGANTPDFRNRVAMGRNALNDALSYGGGDATLDTDVLFAFTPDSATTAPGAGDIQAKTLNSTASADNSPPNVKLNAYVKT